MVHSQWHSYPDSLLTITHSQHPCRSHHTFHCLRVEFLSVDLETVLLGHKDGVALYSAKGLKHMNCTENAESAVEFQSIVFDVDRMSRAFAVGVNNRLLVLHIDTDTRTCKAHEPLPPLPVDCLSGEASADTAIAWDQVQLSFHQGLSTPLLNRWCGSHEYNPGHAPRSQGNPL